MKENSIEEYMDQQEASENHEYDPRKSFNFKTVLCSANSVTIQDVHKNGRYVMILGEAGSGKTTLSRRYLKKIANKSIKCLQHITIVLHVQFKDLNHPNPVYLYEFIIGGAAAKMTKQEKVDLLDYMSNNEEKIAIILDGLDQLQAELPKTDGTIVNVFEKFTQVEFIRAILSEKIFTGSKILLFSRPHAFKKLPDDSLPEYVITLGGLISKDVDLLLTQLGGNDAKLYLKHQNLKAYLLCSNPLMLVYVVASFNKMRSCPSSMAGILLCVIKNIIESKKHGRSLNREVLKRLCSLTYEGTSERRVTFFTEDLRKHSFTNDDVGDMMFVIPVSDQCIKQAILQGQCLFFLSHQSIQEILASLHVFQFQIADIQHFVKHSFGERHWEMIIQSLFAMVCNKNNQRYFKSQINDQDFHKIDEIHVILYDALIQSITSSKDTYQTSLTQIETALMDKDVSNERRRLLKDYKEFYQQQEQYSVSGEVDVTILNFTRQCDEYVDEIVKEYVKGVNLSFHSLTTHAVTSLKDLLHKVDKLDRLYLRDCDLKQEHLLVLLDKSNGDKLPQIDGVSLINNDGIVGECLGSFVNETNVRRLSTQSCEVTKKRLEEFTLDKNNKFEWIRLSGSKISLEMIPAIINLFANAEEVQFDERNEFVADEVKHVIQEAGKKHKNTNVTWYKR